MLATAHSQALLGLDGIPVEVEAHVSRGVPAFTVVGLPDRAVTEARERVRSGITAAELEFPLRRVTVSLAPGALPKLGSCHDLAIAVSVLAATGQVSEARARRVLCLGELALDGRLRPAPGALPAAETAAAAGLEAVLCAAESAPEAALAKAVPAYGVRHLADAARWLRGELVLEAAAAAPARRRDAEPHDLGDVRGQPLARRALELAAVGAHSLLMVGPPGVGKTMLARRLPGILPDLGDAEALEVTRIHSAAGLLDPSGGVVRRPPFRAPHHGCSAAALVGGGAVPRPGELSLAHRGVLFLDELAEFPRNGLEALRQPLEDGEVMVARVGWRARFPAAVQLVAAMNPCPCGGAQGCECSRERIEAYRGRLSGPLLDRLDLALRVDRPSSAALRADRPECSTAVAARVEEARATQRARGQAHPNARLGLAELERHGIDAGAADLLERAADRGGLSARSQVRLLRVARSAADLAGAAAIGRTHLAEALSLRAGAGGR